MSNLWKDAYYTNELAECLSYNWNWDFCLENINRIKTSVENGNEINQNTIYNELKDLQNTLDKKVFKLMAKVYSLTRQVLYKLGINEVDNRKELQEELAVIRNKYGKDLYETIKTDVTTKILQDKVECEYLFRFILWSSKLVNGKYLVLIPMWASLILPSNLKVTSFFGDSTSLLACDKDNRFGCLAFGILITE